MLLHHYAPTTTSALHFLHNLYKGELYYLIKQLRSKLNFVLHLLYVPALVIAYNRQNASSFLAGRQRRDSKGLYEEVLRVFFVCDIFANYVLAIGRRCEKCACCFLIR